MNYRPHALYIFRAVLLAFDIVVAIGMFHLGVLLTGWGVFLTGNVEGTAGLIVLSLVSVSFFYAYRLYSYHFLFSRKTHVYNLIKAFAWSVLTFGVIVVLFNSTRLLSRHPHVFLGLLPSTAIVMLFLSRFFWGRLLDFLMAIGMAVLFVGLTGVVCRSGIPLFLTDGFVVFTCLALMAALLIPCRIFLVHLVFNNWLKRAFRQQVAIIGSDVDAERITRHIVDNNAPFFVVGTISSQVETNLELPVRKPLLGKVEKLEKIVEEHKINEIIITDENIGKPLLVTILDYCTSYGINVWFSPKLLPIIDVKLFLDRFCNLPLILLRSQKNTRLFSWAKLVIDVPAALCLLVLVSPLVLLIAVAIKLDSPGPIFYRPQAVTKHGKIFRMFKFRSMVVDSDNKIHKDYVSKLIKGEVEKKEGDDAPLKITDDPRVTKVGKLIRKFSLDELPQLLNVVGGDMSLVGPRPCLPYEYELYKDWYKKRTLVRGGITGLWQVTGRSEVTFEDMILLDLYYVYNRSFALDFNILFETIFVVIGKKGAY